MYSEEIVGNIFEVATSLLQERFTLAASIDFTLLPAGDMDNLAASTS